MEPTTVDTAQLGRIFNALPESYVVVDREGVIVAATDSFFAATGSSRERALGVDILLVFPDNPDDPDAKGTEVLHGAISTVIETGQEAIVPPVRYDMEQPDGSFDIRYWQPTFLPVVAADGSVEFVLHGANDVTAQILADQV
ncbi:PAS domain-containing protein [Microbacterium sp. WCS2018Hpa-9]|uniref:PAS domain-containing protein n=1 Tax=Microbacterium sp. WCS2018Hpa-9 TaxID=3073635 RepID=UPI0028895A72|nr:PAS domain-containing protein [Microbacterium sp. WCS2018Hpa-9]